MDFSNSVIMPREDFIELQTAAWDQLPLSVKDRVATTIQTTSICLGIATAVVAGTWGWAKAMDWLDQRTHDRKYADVKAKPETPSE